MLWILYLIVGWICSTYVIVPQARVSMNDVHTPDHPIGAVVIVVIVLSILLAPFWPMFLGARIAKVMRKRGVQQSD